MASPVPTASAIRNLLIAGALAFVALPCPLSAGPPVKYERIVTVSPVPGDATASGAELLAALGSVAGASATDRWLIQVEPGIYDVRTHPLRMKPWVDIEGSGIGMTVITGLGQSGPLQFDLGVVNGADASEMRDLTVECRTDAVHTACITIANYDASPRYTRMSVRSTTPGGFHWGFRNTLAGPRLEQVEIRIGNGTSDYGIANGLGGHPVVLQSTIDVNSPGGNAYGVFNSDTGVPAVFEGNRIAVAGDVESVGIFSFDAGMASNDLTVRDTTIVARGAGTTFGISGGQRLTTVEHSRIEALGPNGHALFDASFIPGVGFEVRSSELFAADTIAEAAVVRIGASQVAGGGAITGLFTEQCAAVYNDSFTHFPNACP